MLAASFLSMYWPLLPWWGVQIQWLVSTPGSWQQRQLVITPGALEGSSCLSWCPGGQQLPCYLLIKGSCRIWEAITIQTKKAFISEGSKNHSWEDSVFQAPAEGIAGYPPRLVGKVRKHTDLLLETLRHLVQVPGYCALNLGSYFGDLVAWRSFWHNYIHLAQEWSICLAEPDSLFSDNVFILSSVLRLKISSIVWWCPCANAAQDRSAGSVLGFPQSASRGCRHIALHCSSPFLLLWCTYTLETDLMIKMIKC